MDQRRGAGGDRGRVRVGDVDDPGEEDVDRRRAGEGPGDGGGDGPGAPACFLTEGGGALEPGELAERGGHAQCQHWQRDTVRAERRCADPVVMVATRGQHGDGDHRDQRDRRALGGEDHQGAEPD